MLLLLSRAQGCICLNHLDLIYSVQMRDTQGNGVFAISSACHRRRRIAASWWTVRVAAGAINSPKLLMLSGVGAAFRVQHKTRTGMEPLISYSPAQQRACRLS